MVLGDERQVGVDRQCHGEAGHRRGQRTGQRADRARLREGGRPRRSRAIAVRDRPVAVQGRTAAGAGAACRGQAGRAPAAGRGDWHRGRYCGGGGKPGDRAALARTAAAIACAGLHDAGQFRQCAVAGDDRADAIGRCAGTRGNGAVEDGVERRAAGRGGGAGGDRQGAARPEPHAGPRALGRDRVERRPAATRAVGGPGAVDAVDRPRRRRVDRGQFQGKGSCQNGAGAARQGGSRRLSKPQAHWPRAEHRCGDGE